MAARFGPVCLLGICVASLVGACGASRSDISGAVDSFNRHVASSGVRFHCPTKVETDKAFSCDVRGMRTKKTTTVRLHLVGKKKELIDFVDSATARRAIARVAG